MHIINFEYLSRNMVKLDIEAWARKDQIKRVIVWDDEKAEKIDFSIMSIEDQEAILEAIWERVVLEEQADETELQRLRDGFNQIWVEANSQGYADWLNSMRGSQASCILDRGGK